MPNKNNARCLVVVLFLSFCSLAFAQEQRPYRMSEDEVKQLLQRIEKGADQFRGSLDKALDKSPVDGTKTEDNINKFIKRFEQASDHLKHRFSDKQSAASDVQELLERAVFIDRFMTHHTLTARAQEDWTHLRRLLDELATAYNVTWDWSGVSNQAARSTDKDVKALLRRLEDDANRFRKGLDAALDRSLLDGSKAEDNINNYMKEFAQATDRLKDRYSDHKTAVGTVQEVLQRAARIDGFVARHVTTTRVQEDWQAVRNDLNQLASAYSVTWQW
ncbi:MAG: hypothetical protein U0Y68_05445 [Blastocatellia bacterium]